MPASRLLRALLIAIALAVAMSRPVSAADYSVAYALEVEGKTETGKIENCNTVDSCVIKFRSFNATAHFYYSSAPTSGNKVVLSMWGDSACCYFRDGADTISLDPEMRLHTVTVYAGHARRGNEVLNNEKLGVLYLSFAMSR